MRRRPDLDNTFLWATGIEDTFVPQVRRHFRPLDEYELMDHYDHWREDLALVRDAGFAAVRWGVPWYRVEPEEGRFDWSWTDEVIPYLVNKLGVEPIVDLVHYGCPLWLQREFVNPRYPEAVAAYAAAFARRYHGLVRWYTPLNEPTMTARMCGRRGVWPPYLRGDRGFVRVLLQAVRGIALTAQAIKEVDSQAVIVQVDPCSIREPAESHFAAIAEEDRLRTCLAYDLLLGMVTPEHPLYAWLLQSRATEEELAAIAERPMRLDVMGLNFYPQWSAKLVYPDARGRVAYRRGDPTGSGFEALIEGHYRRYGYPIMVTETSALGPDSLRSQWLQASLDAIRRLRERGVPVIGYTWFPLFTMIDWAYRSGKRPLEAYHLDLGLYTPAPDGAGTRWQRTPLVDELQPCMRSDHFSPAHARTRSSGGAKRSGS